MEKNMNLAKPFAPRTTYIHKKTNYEAKKTVHCSYLALFWQHKKLHASCPSCQFRRAQGCRSSAEQHFCASDPQLILQGWSGGKGGKGQPQCQTSDQLGRFQLAISSVRVRSSDSEQFRSKLSRLYCYWCSIIDSSVMPGYSMATSIVVWMEDSGNRQVLKPF